MRPIHFNFILASALSLTLIASAQAQFSGSVGGISSGTVGSGVGTGAVAAPAASPDAAPATNFLNGAAVLGENYINVLTGGKTEAIASSGSTTGWLDLRGHTSGKVLSTAFLARNPKASISTSPAEGALLE